jgi:hypothetical protein
LFVKPRYFYAIYFHIFFVFREEANHQQKIKVFAYILNSHYYYFLHHSLGQQQNSIKNGCAFATTPSRPISNFK